jgi:hypothetical protein
MSILALNSIWEPIRMFRVTDPQESLLGVEYMLGKEKMGRMKKTWAQPFRTQVLPLINEEAFADMYCLDNGAPNKSVRTMVAIHLLKDQYDLTDEETLQMYEWNNQWHFALAVDPAAAHLCRKTMHNFRVRVVETEKGRELFDQVADGVAKLGKIDFGVQRTDSTHIVSNMMLLNRLGLFVKTIEGFLDKLERMDPKRLEGLPERFFERYINRKGYFADSKSSKARRKLEACAKDLHWLIEQFGDDEKISNLKQYRRMKRLFKEQCKVVDGEGTEEDRVAVKEPKSKSPEDKIPSDSMQSPSDEDATYGHKGKGYEAQISETCAKKNPFQVITDVAVTDSCGSDHNETLPTIDRLDEAGRRPDDLYADTTYISAENIQEADGRGVNLIGPIAGGPEKDDLLHLHEFELDDDGRIVNCPVGQVPQDVRVIEKDTGEKSTQYFFDRDTCLACHLASECPVIRKQLPTTRSTDEQQPASTGKARLTVTEKDIVVAQRKKLQETAEFKEAYKCRSGIEATNSEIKRKHGAGKLKVREGPRVRLSFYLKASAVNVKRFLAYATSEGAVGLRTAPVMI